MAFETEEKWKKKIITVATEPNECRQLDLIQIGRRKQQNPRGRVYEGRPARIQTFFSRKILSSALRSAVGKRGVGGGRGCTHSVFLLKVPFVFSFLLSPRYLCFFVQVNVIVPGHLAAALSALERLIIMWCIEFFTVPNETRYHHHPPPLPPFMTAACKQAILLQLLHFIITQLPCLSLSLSLSNFQMVSVLFYASQLQQRWLRKKRIFASNTQNTFCFACYKTRPWESKEGGGEGRVKEGMTTLEKWTPWYCRCRLPLLLYVAFFSRLMTAPQIFFSCHASAEIRKPISCLFITTWLILSPFSWPHLKLKVHTFSLHYKSKLVLKL